MKVVFVHDHRFRKIGNNIYSPGGLPDAVLTRYVEWFGKVKVVGRISEEVQPKPSYSRIINPNIQIVTNENLKTLIMESDCVVIRLPSINGYRAIRYAEKCNKPYLVEVVGCVLDAYWNYGLKGKLLAVPAYLLMRSGVRNAPYAIYVTSRFLQNRYPCKGRTAAVSDVAILPTFEEVIVKRAEKIRSDKEAIILGTAGAIDVAYKGQEYVIKAIPELRKKTGKKILYELAGSGDCARLRKIAAECGVSDSVCFRGTIKHESMINWLDTLDIYLQPSMLEGLSRAVLEAMSRGLPCIASECGGNSELIEKTYLYPITKKRDVPTFIAAKVTELVENKNEAERQAKKNFEIANGRYGNEYLKAMRDSFYSEFAFFAAERR